MDWIPAPRVRGDKLRGNDRRSEMGPIPDYTATQR
jgi:hypothetical protein